MVICSGQKYATGTRNRQQKQKYVSQVMAGNLFKYIHFPVIAILKQRMANHLHKVKKGSQTMDHSWFNSDAFELHSYSPWGHAVA
jgi:hypothetical protein